MKKFFIIALLSLSSLSSFAEFAVIDRIVYLMDFEKLTATVLNFQTSTTMPCSVNIPETIWYKNDTYMVTGLACYSFDYDAFSDYQATAMFLGVGLASLGMNDAYEREREERKYKYDYAEARANIEHLFLPNTLTEIKAGAFDGMKRLKELVIPASVVTFTDLKIGNVLCGTNNSRYPRLERITILGTPSCATGFYVDGQKEVNVGMQNAKGEYTYKEEMAYVFAKIDPYSRQSDICPNLISFSMPNADKGIEDAINNKSLCEKYNKDLETLCNNYNAALKEHVFYDGTVLTCDPIKLSNRLKDMRQPFLSQQIRLKDEFEALVNGKMEAKLRQENKGKYIQCYRIAHPEQQRMIDSIYLECRCRHSWDIDNAVLCAIEGKSYSLASCREEKYKEYGTLFADRAEYDSIYDAAENDYDFRERIGNRMNIKNRLVSFEDNLKRNPKMKLQGIAASDKYQPFNFMSYYKLLKYSYCYSKAVQLVLSLNEQAKKEYSKNGHYFSSPEEFLEAYISAQYKAKLKERKKK